MGEQSPEPGEGLICRSEWGEEEATQQFEATKERGTATSPPGPLSRLTTSRVRFAYNFFIGLLIARRGIILLGGPHNRFKFICSQFFVMGLFCSSQCSVPPSILS